MTSPKPKPEPKPKAPRGPRQKPGPKPWVPTEADRLEIARLTSVGITDHTIAKRLKVSEAALKRQCAEELSEGRNLARAEVAILLWNAAGKGNVAAMKRLSEMQSASGARDEILGDAEQHATRAAEARIAPLGKKEQRLKAAAIAGQDTEWAGDLGLPN